MGGGRCANRKGEFASGWEQVVSLWTLTSKSGRQAQVDGQPIIGRLDGIGIGKEDSWPVELDL